MVNVLASGTEARLNGLQARSGVPVSVPLLPWVDSSVSREQLLKNASGAVLTPASFFLSHCLASYRCTHFGKHRFERCAVRCWSTYGKQCCDVRLACNTDKSSCSLELLSCVCFCPTSAEGTSSEMSSCRQLAIISHTRESYAQAFASEQYTEASE